MSVIRNEKAEWLSLPISERLERIATTRLEQAHARIIAFSRIRHAMFGTRPPSNASFASWVFRDGHWRRSA